MSIGEPGVIADHVDSPREAFRFGALAGVTLFASFTLLLFSFELPKPWFSHRRSITASKLESGRV
jgi:hypothetical protein